MSEEKSHIEDLFGIRPERFAELLQELADGKLPNTSLTERRVATGFLSAMEDMTSEARGAWLAVMQTVMPTFIQLVAEVHALEKRVAALEADASQHREG